MQSVRVRFDFQDHLPLALDNCVDIQYTVHNQKSVTNMIPSRSYAARALVAGFVFFQISTGWVLAGPVTPADQKKELDKHVDEARRLSKAGEDEQALVEIDKALKVAQGPTLYRCKAEFLLNLGRPKEALVEAKNAAKLEPENAGVHALLGSCFDAVKMDTDALNEFNIAIGKQPNDRGFRAWRSQFYDRHHEYDKSASDLTVIISSTEMKNRAKPLERRANCYMMLKDYPKAIADFTAALTCSYGRSELLRHRALAYDRLGNHVAAQKDIKAAGVMDGDFEPPSTLGANK
jgi:tetratricopeptide (TPR) repeat protein